MKIYAIIVTYNAMRRQWIELCLRSIEQSTVPMTAIVIDNGSTDETRQYVPEHFPDAVWLPQDKNLGFGQGNNVGLRYAMEHDADYVLLLNQDATIAPDAIEKMLPLSDGHTLLSPLHLNGDGSMLDESFKYCLSLSHTTLVDDLLIRHKAEDAYSTPKSHVPAACWLLPVQILRSVGGFNPLFFHYGEDENYIRRMKYHGIGIKVCTAATMRHDRGKKGDPKLFNRVHCHRMLLAASTDINHTFASRFKEKLVLLKNCYFSFWPQGMYRPGRFLWQSLWMCLHYGKIRHSRREERKVQPTWL